MENKLKRSVRRVIGNWMTGFLSPLTSTTIVFNLEFLDENWRILLSAIFSGCIVAGFVIVRELDRD